MLDRLINPIKSQLDRHVVNLWGVPTSEKRKIKVIIDPSAASFIALLRRSEWFLPYPADNSVLDGIRNTSNAIKRGLIKIHVNCKDWIKEAQSYIWDDRSVVDAPVKDNDHLMDATRYFVQTMRILKPQDNYKPIF
jgi:hypothetical protein